MTTISPRPKKSLGQHFLVDDNISRKITGLLDIDATDRVLEIGPGPGALSRWILDQEPFSYIALERDLHWARELKARWPRANVVAMDAMRAAWERLPDGIKVTGNLPYNVASPIMWELFSRHGGMARAVFMVQKEVGKRLTAAPGGRQYGALSVWAQSHALARLEFIVSAHVFRPRPKVESAVLTFTPIGRDNQAFEPEALARCLKLCFQNRRKQLGTILKPWRDGKLEEFFATNDIKPEARPETLTPEEFQELASLLKNRIAP